MANLKTLHPQLVEPARWLYHGGKYYDGRLVVTSARRSSRKQMELYKKYIKGESQIPAAMPGKSLHEWGLAFDLARIGIDPLNDPLLNWLGSIWEQIGGRYGGQSDPVHFQVRM